MWCYLDKIKNFLFPKKRKRDQRDGLNNSAPPLAKRFRACKNEDFENTGIFGKSYRDDNNSAAKMNSKPPVITLSDVSDDESDDEIVVVNSRKAAVNDPDIQIVEDHIVKGMTSCDIRRNSTGNKEVVDSKTRNRYGELIRSRGSIATVFGHHRTNEPSQRPMRRTLFHGQSPSSTSPSRQRPSGLEFEAAFKRTKDHLKGFEAFLTRTASMSSANTPQWAHTKEKASYCRLLLHDSTNAGPSSFTTISQHAPEISLPPEKEFRAAVASADTALSNENQEVASECISIDETSSSNENYSRDPSQSPNIKRYTSLERLDELCSSRPPISEKFIAFDPANLRLSLAHGTDGKLRRRQDAEKLAVEIQLRRDERLSRQKTIEDEVRLRMRLEGLVIEEKEVKEEAEFIELTDEEIEFVRMAVGKGRATDVLVDGFNVKLTKHDLMTLTGSNWLNDEVINFYMNLLMERGGKNGFCKVYAMTTFFYPKLIQSGHDSLKRWTKKADIFSFDVILVPVHLGVHWCLGVIDFRDKTITYYDSMGGKNQRALEALLEYLQLESLDKKKVEFPVGGWKLIHAKSIPHQTNGSDCGVFTCRFAEYISRDATINFTQDHMPNFRAQMIYEILKKRLLKS